MRKVQYGSATYSRWAGSIDWDIRLPMENVVCGNFYEFFKSAGEEGWELCGAFSSGTVGNNVVEASGVPPHKTTDSSEYITLLFKKV